MSKYELSSLSCCLPGKMQSKRWEMAFMLWSGILISYLLRVNISVAAQDMRDELNWTESQKGFVLSSFYWGYAVGQIPSSRVAQRYGAKWTFGLSIFIPAVLTLFVPIASRQSFGLALFIRCIIGLFTSACFPSVFHFFPIWVPIQEKTLMIPAIASGMYMGEIIGFSMSGMLVSSEINFLGNSIGGWPSVFYFFGVVGLLWFPCWGYCAYESPAAHPTITAAELAFINHGKCFIRPVNTIRTKETLTVGPNSVKTDSNSNNHYQFSTLELDANPSNTAENSPVFQRTISIGADGTVPVYLSAADEKRDEDTHQANQLNTERFNPLLSTITPSEHVYQTLSLHDDVESDEDNSNMAYRPSSRQLSVLYDREEMLKRTPWKAFFTHPVSLTLFLNSWTSGWIGFTLLSEMPSYLTDVLGFDLTSAGIMCVFPYLSLFVSALVFGILFERMQNQHEWSVDTVRQVAEYVCFVGAVAGLVACSFSADNYLAYAFMIITQLTFGAGQSGLGCAYSDVAPNYSSTLNSIGNAIGAVAGIVGPIVVALCIEAYPGVWGWRLAFFLTGAMGVVSLVAWSLYFRAAQVSVLNMPAEKRR